MKSCLNILLVLIIATIFVAANAATNDDQCDYEPAPAFTWEGRFNPYEFNNWVVFDSFSSSPGFVYAICQNPDKNDSVQRVAVLLFLGTGSMVGYQYFEDGIPKMFELNKEGNRYVLRELSPKEARSCTRCHQNQIVPSERI